MPSAVIHLHTGVVDRCPTAGGIASTSMTTALVNSIGVDAFVLHQLRSSPLSQASNSSSSSFLATSDMAGAENYFS